MRTMNRNIVLYWLAILLVVIGCESESPEWFLDESYSSHLLGSSRFYQLRTGLDSAASIDTVQIFRTDLEHAAMTDLQEIRSQQWVYETSDGEWIESLFLSAREDLSESCVVTKSKHVLHILAFDRDLMRVGYLKYYPCPDAVLGALAPYGTSSLYFSRGAARTLKSWARASSRSQQ